MRERLDSLLRKLVRQGLRRGLVAGDGKWLVFGAVAWLVRFLMKKREPEVVTEELRVGESLVVTNVGPELPRRQRRAAAASAEG